MKTCPVCDVDYTDKHSTCPTDGSVLIESYELAPDSLVHGKYRIVRKLGQGGMGEVYLAEHLLLGGRVALKFLAPELSRNSQFIKRFRNEARVTFQLHHPNVVEVMDLDQNEDGSLFIAMEYVDGPSLRAAIEGAQAWMPVERALAITRGVASGLAAAHERGTVHRDIKPENILLTCAVGREEQPKVLDFGIAAMLEGATAVSRTKGLMLTPEYASPEQWRGTPAAELDGRTDLYALGVVLYEMLTGRTPFHAHNMEGWMFQHLQEIPKPPSQLRPELAIWLGLDALVLRMLARDRELRHKDAAELIRTLDAVQVASGKEQFHTVLDAHSLGTTAIREEDRVRSQPTLEPTPKKITVPPPAPPLADTKFKSRRFPRWAWGALATLVLVVVFAAGRLFTPQPQPTPAPSPTQQPKQDDDAAAKLAAQESALKPVWTDPATGLIWAKKDNGSDVNWHQASDYCRNLQLAGHTNWRLATIYELQGIFDANVGGHHVKGGLQMSSYYAWSSTLYGVPRADYAEAYEQYFGWHEVQGGPTSLNNSTNGRALCVRRFGE